MASLNNENRSKFSRVGNNRWSRVREAYQAGELDRQNIKFQPNHKRVRRNALADISTVSTNANTTCQKNQFHQLVERVRELQKEIVPDLLLYQIPQNYSPFQAVTPGSNGSRGSISMYPHRQSISLSSGSSNTSLPIPVTNQRFGLSSRILERAHQIPERFWIDWQQKQMQDQIEELEYIKQNIGYGSSSSLLSNETDENGTDFSTIDRHTNYNDMRRKSVLFLQEAQRLANERRTSLARTTTIDASTPKKNKKKIDLSDEEEDHNSFNFDQRSEETVDTANLNDVNEIPPEPITPLPTVQKPQPTQDRPRSPISLPFTYTKTREETLFPNNYRQLSAQPTLEKIIEINDNAMQTTSSIHNTEQVVQNNTEIQHTLHKREDPKQFNPLLCSKTTVNRSVEFHRFRSISSRNYTTLSNKNMAIHIPVSKRKEMNDSRSSSPTLSFKSTRSRFSSVDNGEDLDDDIQSVSVIPSSLSVSSHSRSTSPHIISTNTQCYDHNNNYFSLKNQSSHKCIYSTQDPSMTNVDDLEQNYKSSSCSSYSDTPSEEEDNLSFSRTLFTCRHQQRRRKKKGNASNLSLVSRTSLPKNLTLRHDSFCQAKVNDNNNNKNHSTLKITHNTSITSSQRTGKWKQNAGGFQRDVLADDNNDGDEHFVRSSSPSAAVAADWFIRRQYRKQTRLKKKTGSEKKKEKKKKKERNKKSQPSTIAAEATEASLFQFNAVDAPTIDTSAIFYPHEQARYADKSTAKEKNSFSIQTLAEHQQKQECEFLIMADGHGYTSPDPVLKKKENVRVFVRRRRQCTTKQRKRAFLHSSSSGNSHETIPSSSDNAEELVSLIQQQLNTKQKQSRKNNNNIIVVNYKPVFVNSRPQKSSKTSKTPPISIPKPTLIPTDDDFSSATHYSRRRSFTTTSSDGSPLPSTTSRSHNQQSVSLDVPDVEDPLMFIEMMYQQLFTEDGRLRSGTEPTVLENCVKQIVTNSRRNSVSSSIANGSTTSSHLKQKNLNINHEQRKFSSPSYHPLTSRRLMSNEHYKTFSEEEEEEPNTLIQTNSQHQTIKFNNNISERSSKRLSTDSPEDHSQILAFLNSCQEKRATTASSGFRFSIDDTDNEDLDTFSDLNSIRFNNKTVRTSPSVDEDLTHTDSRLLSSSGYQSLDRSTKYLQQQKLIRSKSHSENDLFNSLDKNHTQIKCIHYCPNCIHSPNITVIPPIIPPPSTSSSLNIIKRIQQPIGYMLMKYLNFLLISKNVLLLPLFIFLLRQRSLHLGN